MENKLKDILVEKRNGVKEPFDVLKIKKSIALAVEGTKANPLHLESKIDSFIKNGIDTKSIQENVIFHAVQLANAQEPYWLNVAGRALAMDEWASFKLKDKSLYEIISYNVKKGLYSKELLECYSEEDINSIEKVLDFKYDLDHSYASLITAKKKYLGKFELNQHMHMVNAMRFGQYEPKETRISFVKQLYKALAERKISLATPFLSNLRKGGNVASCFIISIKDDLDSIFGNVHNIARISKNGGGLGIYLGLLRAKGSSVNGAENSSGSVTQWVKIINDTLVAVNQGGKRKGAGTVALPIWHNDILDFLDMQTEHGDPRSKSYDVFPQVCVHDIFLERDVTQQEWYTFCPFEVKTKLGIDIEGKYGKEFENAYLQIEIAIKAGKLKVFRHFSNARELTKIIMKTQFETGLPYIAFIDTINEENPNKHDGYIPCVNLCVESFSNVKPDEYGHVCNLASLVLGNIKNLEEVGKIARLATKLLDYGIELTNTPIHIAKAHNNRYRTVGVGIMGLHDYLAREHLTYNNTEVISNISETVAFNCIVESIESSKKFGSFTAFEGSEWQNGNQIAKFKERSKLGLDWDSLQQDINSSGIRNSEMFAIAPNTSTSIYMDSSASTLPLFSPFFSEDNKNGSMKVSAKYLDKNPLGYGKTLTKFKAKEIIDFTAEIQKHVDTGISMELLFDQQQPDFKAKDLYDAIHYAHSKKIKTIYYIRGLKKNAEINQEADCIACAG